MLHGCLILGFCLMCLSELAACGVVLLRMGRRGLRQTPSVSFSLALRMLPAAVRTRLYGLSQRLVRSTTQRQHRTRALRFSMPEWLVHSMEVPALEGIFFPLRQLM